MLPCYFLPFFYLRGFLKKISLYWRLYLAVLALILASGCANAPRTAPPAYLPHSILVLPPTNRSVEVTAPYVYLATITKPLAEKGYYVFPVAVIDRFMRENGLHVPAEMHTVPLAKIREHIGADAVLYVEIIDWGQKFQIVSSAAVVKAQLRLVDVATGQQMWAGYASATYSPNSQAGNGLMGAVLGAVIDQVAGALNDRTYPLARQANNDLINERRLGLTDGPILLEHKALEAKTAK